jgi:hypothetical protein
MPPSFLFLSSGRQPPVVVQPQVRRQRDLPQDQRSQVLKISGAHLFSLTVSSVFLAVIYGEDLFRVLKNHF